MANFKSQSTKARYEGTIAFHDVGAAQRLVEVMNSVLERTLDVFWVAKDNQTYPIMLSKDLTELADLCYNFVSTAEACQSAEAQQSFRELHKKLAKAVAEANSTLGEYHPGQRWTLAQVNSLEDSFSNTYRSMQEMMNLSESLVATSLSKNVSRFKDSIMDMRDKQKKYTWNSLVGNVDMLYPVVSKSLRNRITVTLDPEDVMTLEDVVKTLESSFEPMKKACLDFKNGKNSESEKNRLCVSMIFALQRALDVLRKHIIGDALFNHHGIEPERFNETLDDLVNSINGGDANGMRGAAQDLTDQLKDMERRRALEDAQQFLLQQTKNLMQAGQEALKNKDSEDARKRLNDLVRSMKTNVADLAAQEKAAAERKAQLLRTAGGLGVALDSMTNSASAFREGREGPVLDRTKIDEEERAREVKLSNLKRTSARISQADTELDALLKELDI